MCVFSRACVCMSQIFCRRQLLSFTSKENLPTVLSRENAMHTSERHTRNSGLCFGDTVAQLADENLGLESDEIEGLSVT